MSPLSLATVRLIIVRPLCFVTDKGLSFFTLPAILILIFVNIKKIRTFFESEIYKNWWNLKVICRTVFRKLKENKSTLIQDWPWFPLL